MVEQEQQGKGWAAYGKEGVRQLTERVATELGKGFSDSKLTYVRTRFFAYRAGTDSPHAVWKTGARSHIADSICKTRTELVNH